MTNATRRQKIHYILNSIPVAVALNGLPFGALMANIGNGPFLWPVFIFATIGFGVPMGIIMKKKINEMPGMARTNEDWKLLDYFKKGTLPRERRLAKAMPAYIEKAELQLYISKKSLPTMTGIGLMGILYGAMVSKILVVCSVFILGMMVFSFFSMKKTIKNIDSLKEQIRRRHLKTVEAITPFANISSGTNRELRDQN